MSGVTEDEVLAARCPGCGYTYDVVTGGVRAKVDFVPVEPAQV